jgi:hypothetical protein
MNLRRSGFFGGGSFANQGLALIREFFNLRA